MNYGSVALGGRLSGMDPHRSNQRLEPELKKALDDRAADDGESTSALIRQALRAYLQTS